MKTTATHSGRPEPSAPAPFGSGRPGSASAVQGGLLASVFCILGVAACFGPYVSGGLRTEQIYFYAVAVVSVLTMPTRWLGLRFRGAGIALVVIWTTYAVIGAVGAVGDPPASRFLPGPVAAGVDNLVLPLAVVTSTWVVVGASSRAVGIRSATKAVAWFGAANGVLAVIGTRVDLTQLLRPFWGAANDRGLTVSELAAQLGRISGVFNQPAEAGLMYGIAGLAAIYAYRARQRVLILLLIPIFLGGALCVSKVFLLVGGPLVLWQAWLVVRSRAVFLFAGAVTVVVIAQGGVFTQWVGTAYLQRLIHPSGNGGVVNFYTAGRLGAESTLAEVVSEVQSRAPMTGFGAGGLRVPYDNGWVEAFVVAGLVGVLCYSAALICMLVIALSLHDAERRLGWGLVALAVGASVGLPALTANRSGALLWLLVALLALPDSLPLRLEAIRAARTRPRASTSLGVDGADPAPRPHT